MQSACLSHTRSAPCHRVVGLGRQLSSTCRRRSKAVVVHASERLLEVASTSVPSLLDHVAAHITTGVFVLGDAGATAAAAAVSAAAQAAPAAEAGSAPAGGAVDAAATAVQAVNPAGDGGIFQPLADGFESFLKVLDQGLEALHVPYSYGFAIILLTLIVKLATFPLSKKQVESTLALQALQPYVKELQGKYANDPEKLQLETARLYQQSGVNPLAGCLPSLVQIPIFIGLYRAFTQAGFDGLLKDSFFWVPSLAGPTDSVQGLAWLFPFVDGQPPLGWADTIAYLSLPILLVISQYLSIKITSPPATDPAQIQTQRILQFIPIMVGWFALNVPSGLSLYWLVNNFLTTGQQLFLKATTKIDLPNLKAEAPKPIVKAEFTEVDEKVKKPTGKETGARRKKGEKFRAIKARETAEKAKAVASTSEDAEPVVVEERGKKFKARKASDTNTATVGSTTSVDVAMSQAENGAGRSD